MNLNGKDVVNLRIMVFAPHPDDEVLGVGGTIARAVAEGHDVTVVIVTKGTDDLFPKELIEQGRKEAQKAHEILGVKDTVFMDFPAAKLDTVPHHILNAEFIKLIKSVKPEVVFAPFKGDIHKDHQIVFDSVMVAVRPNCSVYPRYVYAYETLSETNWNDYATAPKFSPNVYVNISDYVDKKNQALSCYSSQMRQLPSERSVEAAQMLAKLRGATVNVFAAEAFSLVRSVI